MLPTNLPDWKTKATEAQVLQALASLAGLPSRQADEEGIDRAMYFVALEGVSRYALSEAVKAVMRNRLGHTFFPSPVELRRLCDEAIAPHIEAERRIRQREQQARENAEMAVTQALKTPESLARSRRLYERFCEQYEASKPGHEPFVPTLDPELVAKIADAPTAFTKPLRQASGQ